MNLLPPQPNPYVAAMAARRGVGPASAGPLHGPGMLTPGNLDLKNRPIVRNKDGSISTVRSITVTDDNNRAVLLPTVVGGRVVSNDEAIKNWQKTGQHLGVFDTEDNANAYADSLHNGQQSYYSGLAAKPDPTQILTSLYSALAGFRH